MFWLSGQISLSSSIVQVTDLTTAAMAEAQNLLSLSRKFLQQGVVKFESISDAANTALLLSNTGRLERLSGHVASLQSQSEEFGPEEISHYRAAVDCYQRALAVLASRKLSPHTWESVQRELCSTLYQDQPPLSSHSWDQLEKIVTPHLVFSDFVATAAYNVKELRTKLTGLRTSNKQVKYFVMSQSVYEHLHLHLILS